MSDSAYLSCLHNLVTYHALKHLSPSVSRTSLDGRHRAPSTGAAPHCHRAAAEAPLSVSQPPAPSHLVSLDVARPSGLPGRAGSPEPLPRLPHQSKSLCHHHSPVSRPLYITVSPHCDGSLEALSGVCSVLQRTSRCRPHVGQSTDEPPLGATGHTPCTLCCTRARAPDALCKQCGCTPMGRPSSTWAAWAKPTRPPLARPSR
jgi:hypothetical protein